MADITEYTGRFLLEKLIVCHLVKKFLAIHETACTCKSPPLVPILRHTNPVYTLNLISLIGILTLPFHLSPVLSSSLFSACFWTKLLLVYAFLILPMLAAYPAHPTRLDINTLVTADGKCGLSSSVQSVTSSLFGPCIIISVIFSYTANSGRLPNAKDQFHISTTDDW